MSSTGVQAVDGDGADVESRSPRRHLSGRRAQTVARLAEAAVDELADVGYQSLTVRSVAKRAGVAAATAYTYFSSKEHLVAEVFWRRLRLQEPHPVDRRRSAAGRATDVLLDHALVVADETELAAACTVALLVDDPEVHELRIRIGQRLHVALQDALGDGAPAGAIRTLELVLSGALIQVGTGHLAYDDLPDRLAEATALVLGGSR